MEEEEYRLACRAGIEMARIRRASMAVALEPDKQIFQRQALDLARIVGLPIVCSTTAGSTWWIVAGLLGCRKSEGQYLDSLRRRARCVKVLEPVKRLARPGTHRLRANIGLLGS